MPEPFLVTYSRLGSGSNAGGFNIHSGFEVLADVGFLFSRTGLKYSYYRCLVHNHIGISFVRHYQVMG